LTSFFRNLLFLPPDFARWALGAPPPPRRRPTAVSVLLALPASAFFFVLGLVLLASLLAPVGVFAWMACAEEQWKAFTAGMALFGLWLAWAVFSDFARDWRRSQ